MKRVMRKIIVYMCILCLCFSMVTPVTAADGNPLAGAVAIGSDETVTGILVEQDSADYYQYVVPSNSSVEVEATYMSTIRASRVSIYNEQGEVVFGKTVYADSDVNRITEKFVWHLNPGTYYFRILKIYGDYQTYSLQLNTKILNNTDIAADDTLESAHTLPLNTSVKGVLSDPSDDTVDIYKIDVTVPGILKYKFKFYMRSIKISLTDGEGKEINNCYPSWDSNLKQGIKNLEFPLKEGTYYLVISSWNGDGIYTFDQSFENIKSTEMEPNDSLDQAQSLSLGKKAYGMIAYDEDSDFYKIKVPSKRNITFSITSTLSSMHLYLYDADGSNIESCYGYMDSNTKKNSIKKIYKLAAGTYYIQLKSSDSGDYTFMTETTKAPTKGRITTIRRTKKSFWGTRDIYLKLGKSTNAEGYQIYVAKNSKFKSASKYTTETRSITLRSFYAGKTYYVKVRGYRRNSAGDYIYGKFSSVKKIKL